MSFLISPILDECLSFAAICDVYRPRPSTHLLMRYTVHPYDQVLGLYFAQARMYDAQGRRFISFDLYPPNMVNTQSFNRYLYVLDNPMVWIDLYGLTPQRLKDGYVISIQERGHYSGGTVEVHTEIAAYEKDGRVYVDFKEALNVYGITVTGGSIYTNTSYEGAIISLDKSKRMIFEFDDMKNTFNYSIYELSPSSGKYDIKLGASSIAAYKSENLRLIDFEYFHKYIACDLGWGEGRTYKYNEVLETYISSLEIKIDFSEEKHRQNVSSYTVDTLKKIIITANNKLSDSNQIKRIVINSTLRTVDDHINTIYGLSSAAATRFYKPGTLEHEVLAHAQQLKENNPNISTADVISSMKELSENSTNSWVSRHVATPAAYDKYNVVDIGLSSSGLNTSQQNQLKTALDKAKGDNMIAHYIDERPQINCFHVELHIPEAYRKGLK